MNTVELSQWYYLIYLLPGGTALMLLLLSSMGGGGRHHRSGGARGGHKHHATGGSGVKSGGAKAGSGGAKSGARHGKVGGRAVRTERNAAQHVLAYFGAGRVPPQFVWGSALLGWGLFGFWTSQILEARMHFPALFVLPALVAALIGAFVTAKITSELTARLMPQNESYATDTIDLCGQLGNVAFTVDETRGRVHVYDAHGTMHDVRARVAVGLPTIARGRKILVVDYDPASDQVIVEEAP